jgi:hypothetical protein
MLLVFGVLVGSAVALSMGAFGGIKMVEPPKQVEAPAVVIAEAPDRLIGVVTSGDDEVSVWYKQARKGYVYIRTVNGQSVEIE